MSDQYCRKGIEILLQKELSTKINRFFFHKSNFELVFCLNLCQKKVIIIDFQVTPNWEEVIMF